MRIATWNVNSLRVRLPQLLEWLAASAPDVVALQETKLTDDAFPADELRAAGYHCVYSGQKTYNGVATLARTELHEALRDMPGYDDPQRRVLAASVAGVRVINLYVPNGQSVDSDKYHYKLGWLRALRSWLRQELAAHPQLVVLGDFNIAPEDRDVHDPAAWAGSVHVQPGRARGAAGHAGAGAGRRVPPVRAAAAELQLVGLPRRFLPSQPRPAHRPAAGIGAAGRALHGLRHRPRAAPRRARLRPHAGHRHV